jgi:hypothetical protein
MHFDLKLFYGIKNLFFQNTISILFISRLLQTNSFSGKMNALNEINKLLPNLNSMHRSTMNDNDGLTSEKFIVI